ncbi:MAG: TetR/AcrR family transcriptional regulator [Mycobacteriaceae bacterium]|nr:TetR/AcrR family transcriptional regulator [Mycobacteriaceae bacterium]
MTVNSPLSAASPSVTPLGRPVGADGDRTRRRIMTAAMRCVAEVGYSQTTIREIARAADMTSGSLYHYFPNKSELLKATSEEIENIVLPRLRAAVECSDDVADQLDAVLDESKRLIRDYPHMAAFLRAVRSGDPTQSRLGDPQYPGSKALRDVVTEIVENAHSKGALSPATSTRAAIDAICALTRGLTEPAARDSQQAYDATLGVAKRMIRGTLFAHPEPGR